MRRKFGIYLVPLGIALPLLWLALTAEMTGTTAALVAGGALTWAWLVSVCVRAHRRGRLFPHRCLTCGHGLRRLARGELAPARETLPPPPHRWLCSRCGRLV